MSNLSRVEYSNKLNLDHFFYEGQEQIYAIVKMDENFPNYYPGSDIDIFCYDKDAFARSLFTVGNSYLDQGLEILVTDKTGTHTFVDFYFNSQLDFRFDLYQLLPQYKNIRLKQQYFYSVIENAQVQYREYSGARYPIFVPSSVDDLLLRYVEYIEWYEVRPDKLKHLEFIVNAISGEPQRIDFLAKLHAYTALPEPDYTNLSESNVSDFSRSASWLEKLRSVPLRRIPRIIARKIWRFVRTNLRKIYGNLKSLLPHWFVEKK